MQMLTTYGLAFENSPYAALTINSANLFADFKSQEGLLKLCAVLGCVDFAAIGYTVDPLTDRTINTVTSEYANQYYLKLEGK